MLPRGLTGSSRPLRSGSQAGPGLRRLRLVAHKAPALLDTNNRRCDMAGRLSGSSVVVLKTSLLGGLLLSCRDAAESEWPPRQDERHHSAPAVGPIDPAQTRRRPGAGRPARRRCGPWPPPRAGPPPPRRRPAWRRRRCDPTRAGWSYRCPRCRSGHLPRSMGTLRAERGSRSAMVKLISPQGPPRRRSW